MAATLDPPAHVAGATAAAASAPAGVAGAPASSEGQPRSASRPRSPRLRREVNLRLPGPTALPPAVRRALGTQMVNHRGPEFAALQAETVSGVQRVFATQGDVLFFPASSTGGLEAAVVNCFSPGDPVLCVTIGSFGERWCDIARAFGLDVDQLAVPWGSAATAGTVAERLDARPGTKGVFITHNETATGVTNPLAEIAPVVRRAGALLLVDAVSSMAAVPCPVDAWEIDVCITGSQKAWMCPPGLCMVSVSERAWSATRAARLPRSYWDFGAVRDFQRRGMTPYTPAMTVMFGLRAALRLLEDEGMDRVYARHRAIGEYTRRGVQRLGLRLAADPAHASDTVTAVVMPPGITAAEFHRRLREDHHVVLATGQEAWRDSHFRIGHLGHVRQSDIRHALTAIEAVLHSF